MSYNDPQIVHGGECNRCGQWVRDNEEELFDRGNWSVCADCNDEMGEEPDNDAAEPEEPLTLAPRTDWLAIARDITDGSHPALAGVDV